MKGKTQEKCQHSVPRDLKVKDVRYNLTFRYIHKKLVNKMSAGSKKTLKDILLHEIDYSKNDIEKCINIVVSKYGRKNKIIRIILDEWFSNSFKWEWKAHGIGTIIDPLGITVTWDRVLRGLISGNKRYLLLFSADKLIRGLKAVFFECNPVNLEGLKNTIFQCSITRSTELERKRNPNKKTFSKYFSNPKGKYTTYFDNLSGDATLVVPLPTVNVKNKSAFIHLANYLRDAPKPAVNEIWEIVAKQMFERLTTFDKPIWLSTSGLGVPWLHFRISDKPTYYRTKEFKTF